MKMKKKSWFFRFIFASLFFFFIPFPYNLNQQTNASFNKNFLTAKIENCDDKNDNFDEQDKINLVNEIEQKSNNDGLKNHIKIYSNQISVLNYNQDVLDILDREQNQNEINHFFLTNPINQSNNRQKDNYSYFNDKDDKNDNEKKDSDIKHKVLISLLATLVLILTITLVTLTVKKVHEVKNPTNKPD